MLLFKREVIIYPSYSSFPSTEEEHLPHNCWGNVYGLSQWQDFTLKKSKILSYMVRILLIRLWIPLLPFFSASFSCSKKNPGYSNCRRSLDLSVLNLNIFLFPTWKKTTKPCLTVYFAFQTGDCPPGYNCPPGTGFPFSFPCTPGFFWDNSSVEGEDTCRPCPPGYYCDSPAMSEPKTCPAVSCSFLVI